MVLLLLVGVGVSADVCVYFCVDVAADIGLQDFVSGAAVSKDVDVGGGGCLIGNVV